MQILFEKNCMTFLCIVLLKIERFYVYCLVSEIYIQVCWNKITFAVIIIIKRYRGTLWAFFQTLVRPNKKIPLLRVTRPCLNLLEKPRFFSGFVEKI